MSFSTLCLLALGLSADAFAVALMNGMNPACPKAKYPLVAGIFGFLQGLMPLIGWAIAQFFTSYLAQIPHLIAAILLGYLGIHQLLEWYHAKEDPLRCEATPPSLWQLFCQGIATSIDAMASGVTFVSFGYSLKTLPFPLLLICGVTFALCFFGCCLGRRWGEFLNKKAPLIGGGILLFLAVKTLLEGFFS